MNNLISSNIDPNGIVTGGIRKGKNLFYSFTEFSIINKEEVVFTNAEIINFNEGNLSFTVDTVANGATITGSLEGNGNIVITPGNLTTIYQEEGGAFYLYAAGSGLGEERDNIKANLSEWIDKGIIFESL